MRCSQSTKEAFKAGRNLVDGKHAESYIARQRLLPRGVRILVPPIYVTNVLIRKCIVVLSAHVYAVELGPAEYKH
jgi:hypothetical protein